MTESRGEGVIKSKDFADVIYASPQRKAANGPSPLTDLYIFVDKCPKDGYGGLIAQTLSRR